MTLNVWGPRARAVHVAQRHERAELHGAPLQRPRVTPHFSSQAQQALTVRALASGPALQLDTSAGAWSPKGHRLAYVVGANLRVLDMPTGAQTLDVALPSTDGQLGSPSWSPDGRFVLFDGNVVDVAAGRVVELPPAGPYGGIEWRPQRGHLLLRSTYKPVTDLVDAAVPSVLWYRPGQSSLSWSPDGRWLLRDDYENPRAQVLDAKSGRAVHLPSALQRLWRRNPVFYWLSRPAALDINGKALRIARPPTWTPHVVARARRGHLLSGSTVLTATRAGIDLIGRAFGPRARARDC